MYFKDGFLDTNFPLLPTVWTIPFPLPAQSASAAPTCSPQWDVLFFLRVVLPFVTIVWYSGDPGRTSRDSQMPVSLPTHLHTCRIQHHASF